MRMDILDGGSRHANLVTAVVLGFFGLMLTGCGPTSNTGNSPSASVPAASTPPVVTPPAASTAVPAAEHAADQQSTIDAIKALPGKVTVDEDAPGKPIVAVDLWFNQKLKPDDLKLLEGLAFLKKLDLSNSAVTDAGLEHLKGLDKLEKLGLAVTAITDAGLKNISGLKSLRSLDLANTYVTDAGLANLKGLSNLQELKLGGRKITDAGLENLKGLDSLQQLELTDTKATDAGITALQKALPKLKITVK